MTSKPGKQPEDHKTAVEKVQITIGEGDDARTVPAQKITVHGVEVTVPDEAMDDFEVLDDIRAVQDQNDASRLPALLRRLVGDDFKRVLNELRGDNGRVSMEAGTKFVMDLFTGLSAGNS